MEIKKNGKITASVGGLYTVELDTGEKVSCRARGSFRHLGTTPLVGDAVTLVGEGVETVIDEIHERKNSLIRPPLANLDILFVTLSAAKPEPSLFTADKLIAISEHNGIDPCIVVGKCELDPARAEEIKKIYELAGYPVFVLSCFENVGVKEFSEYVNTVIKGKTAAFAGASGAGKSTLMNRLFPDLKLSTGDVSQKTQRGKHTTRTVELFSLLGGYIADTPGFSMIDFERFDFFGKEDLPDTFKEFRECIGECKYKKCTHTKEEGCAILEAIREGKISTNRHKSFIAMYEDLKKTPDWKRRKEERNRHG